MLSVERVDSLSELRGLRRIWNDLVARSPHANLFLSHEWITTWWDHFGDQGRFWTLLVKDGTDIVAVAPMMIRRQSYGRMPARVLGFPINRHVSRGDFLSVLPEPDAFAALARYWRDHAADWDVLLLERMPSESGTMAHVVRALDEAGLDATAPAFDRRVRHLPIAGTWEEYWAGMSWNARRNANKARNRLARTKAVVFECDRGPDRVESSMARLFEVQSLATKRAGSAALDERDRRFHLALAGELAGQGGFENRFLSVGGRTIAAQHYMSFRGTLYCFLTDFDPDFGHLYPGWSLVERMLRDHWSEGRTRVVDFNGDSHFLGAWTDHTRVMERLAAFHHRPYSRLLSGLRMIKQSIRRGATMPETRRGTAS